MKIKLPRKSGMPLIRTAAVLVLFIAMTASAALWGLLKMYDKSVRATATMSVLNIGKLIALHLSEHPAVRQGEDWAGFARLARTLHRMETGLQFVSVARDGATVFHEQLGSAEITAPPDTPAHEEVDLTLDRQLIMFGPETVPVMTFTIRPATEGAGFDSIQVGIRKDAVDREGMLPSLAVRSMFRVALATISVSFGACIIVIVIMMRREMTAEEHRRRQEHLSFAGVMANGIVHDFRNPMSSLKLDAQMLKRAAEKGDSPEATRIKELSARISATLDRMDKVFQEFLYLSKPSARSGEESDLRDVVKDCVEFMKPRLERSGVKLDFEPCETPLKVKGAGTTLGRAVINIITNAEQFSPEQGIVTVKCSRSGKNAVVDVMDEGPGISGNDKARIFDMFYSKRPAGTGMGLFLARTAVEESNGRIELKDKPVKGAWFRITLPLLPDIGKGSL